MLKNVLCMILALSLLAVFPVMAAATDTVSVENFKTFDDVIQFLNDKYDMTLRQMEGDDYPDPYVERTPEELRAFYESKEAFILKSKALSEIEEEFGCIDYGNPKVRERLAALWPENSPEHNPENSSEAPARAPYAKTQYCYFPIGGGIALKSSCNWHPTGSYTVYSSINDIVGATASDRTSFKVSGSSYSLSSDKRTCYVTVKGSHTDANGYNDLVMRTYRNIIFSADD